ncbi:DUF599 domain-containing protein [Pseudorhodobacter ferrugineus]|uniref:DUF599 domain-containing protein n=1 Tax=Pseudorhodobacter ferrugineus TaxID=77008 RepID=UPI0003B7A05F|nr:DUF599 domain-containing protein [Pseudorhodobacter ferrugineus]
MSFPNFSPAMLAAFSAYDLAAVAFLLASAVVIGWVVENPPAAKPSVTVLMKQYRRDWMVQFVTRQPRIFDATVLDSLRQGTAFFASACMITLGGGIAVIGNSERLDMLAADLTLEAQGVALELKVALVLIFVANALLKFIWAHRLFGYCTIMMAAVPNNAEDTTAYARAADAAEINITAARSFNKGLRSIYFALGSLGWLLGPWGLVATVLVTASVLLRREFMSASREIILRRTQG